MPNAFDNQYMAEQPKPAKPRTPSRVLLASLLGHVRAYSHSIAEITSSDADDSDKITAITEINTHLGNICRAHIPDELERLR